MMNALGREKPMSDNYGGINIEERKSLDRIFSELWENQGHNTPNAYNLFDIHFNRHKAKKGQAISN
jgi:hypothetical protein